MTKNDSFWLLELKAKKLARKFYDDCQTLFDNDSMTPELADGEIFSALSMAQAYAEDAAAAHHGREK